MKSSTIIILLYLGAIPFFADAEIKNLRFFGLWLGAGNASILRFQSTLIIPNGSPDATVDYEVQAIWPGVQGKGLLQNVITNGGKPGQWWQLPFYCCNPGLGLRNETQVYPGDRVTNTFVLDQNTMKWHDSYVVTPGRQAHAAGNKIVTDAFQFDQDAIAKDNTTVGDRLTMTFMTIELQGNGTWDFDPVKWRDILVTINTTENTWCKTGPTLGGGTDFNYTFSKPRVSTNDGITSCYISDMNFISPTKYY